MSHQLLKGICTAALTMFTKDMELDEAATAKFCEFQIKSGVHGLFVNGSTAEFAAMPPEMQKKGVKLYEKHISGRVPMVVHVGSARLEEAKEMAAFAATCDIDGIASVPPYFYGYDLPALIGYYAALSEAAPGLPLYIYNFPAAAGNNITPAMLKGLKAAVPALAGVKDTSQNYVQYVDYLDAMGLDFRVIMGSDAMVLGALAIGGQGAISAAAASFPELMVEIYDAFQGGDLDKGRKLQFLASRLRLLFGKAPIQARRKAALALRGFELSPVIQPGRSLTDAEFAELCDALKKLETEFEYPLLVKVG